MKSGCLLRAMPGPADGTYAMENSSPSETSGMWTGDFLISNLGSFQKKEGLHPWGGGGGGGNAATFRARA